MQVKLPLIEKEHNVIKSSKIENFIDIKVPPMLLPVIDI